MLKNDPRFEITPEIRGMLMAAVLSSESGKRILPFLSDLGKDQHLRNKNIANLQLGNFFDQQKADAMSQSMLDGLINNMAALIPAYYKAIDRGDARKLKEVFDKGFPVDIPNPVSGGTALHSLAAGGARPAIRLLLTYEDINFLARDNKGRLPSEMAYLYGNDPALARLLGNKERKQAEAKGIKLTRRPPTKSQP